jgi:hypothetical protein
MDVAEDGSEADTSAIDGRILALGGADLDEPLYGVALRFGLSLKKVLVAALW